MQVTLIPPANCEGKTKTPTNRKTINATIPECWAKLLPFSKGLKRWTRQIKMFTMPGPKVLI